MEKLQLQSPLRKIIDTMNAVIERSNNDTDLLKSFRCESEKFDIFLSSSTLNGGVLEIKTAGQYRIYCKTKEGSIGVYLNDPKGVNGVRYDLDKINDHVDLLLMAGDILCFRTKNVAQEEKVQVTLNKNLLEYIYDNAEDLDEAKILCGTLKEALSKVDNFADDVKELALLNKNLGTSLDALKEILNGNIDTLRDDVFSEFKKTVYKVDGMQLSSNDFTDYHKDQLQNLSVISSDVDINGFYKTVLYKDKNGSTVYKTELLGTAPRYNQLKLSYYKNNQLVNSQIWNLTYDANDFVYRKELR